MSDLSRFLPPEDDETKAYLAALGRMLLAWNTVEQVLTEALEYMVTERRTDRRTFLVLSAELGTVGLTNAIRSLAKLEEDIRIKEMAEHACDYFDLLRAYRNHYVHGISYVIRQGGEVLAAVHPVSARRELKQSLDHVRASDLERVSQGCAALSAYVMGTLDSLGSVRIPGAETPTPPCKPALPDKLEKRAIRPLRDPPRS